MGKTANDIQREITEIRAETDDVLAVLEVRVREMFNLRSQARRHPLVISGLGFGLVSGLSLLAYALFLRSHPTASPSLHRAGSFHTGEQPGILKRALWAAFASSVAAVGSILAKRLAAGVWMKASKELLPST